MRTPVYLIISRTIPSAFAIYRYGEVGSIIYAIYTTSQTNKRIGSNDLAFRSGANVLMMLGGYAENIGNHSWVKNNCEHKINILYEMLREKGLKINPLKTRDNDLELE